MDNHHHFSPHDLDFKHFAVYEPIEKPSRRNRLYNYLINTFGITQEKINEHIEMRLEDLVSKELNRLLTSQKFDDLIARATVKVIEKKDYFDDKNRFMQIIEKVISERLNNEYAFSVKINANNVKQEGKENGN